MKTIVDTTDQEVIASLQFCNAVGEPLGGAVVEMPDQPRYGIIPIEAVEVMQGPTPDNTLAITDLKLKLKTPVESGKTQGVTVQSYANVDIRDGRGINPQITTTEFVFHNPNTIAGLVLVPKGGNCVIRK